MTTVNCGRTLVGERKLNGASEKNEEEVMSKKNRRPLFSVSLAVATLFVLVFAGTVYVPSAHSVPSFSRQTGFPCSSCHTTPPELTPLGRTFKLSGYTLSGAAMNKVEKTGQQKSGLSLLQVLPLSVFFDTSFTSTKTAQPGTQNGSFEFPQDVSLFLAGEWSTHVGSFVQFTYDSQKDHFTWDNTDIRYANSRMVMGKDLMYGLTLNNSPTLEDLWNSTPAWGYPFTSNDFAPKPTAAALINLSLSQDVAGIGAYEMWNNHLYLAGTLYRSHHIGATQPFNGQTSTFNVHGVAPYWRVAWQQSTTNNYLEVGAYGMHMRSTPNGFTTGPQNSFTDWAADFQFDRTIPQFNNNIVSFRGTYIRENASLNGSVAAGLASAGAHHLNTVQANVEYHFGNRYTGTFGWFNTSGTADPVLYNQGCTTPPCAITGSASGSPKSNGYILNVSWWPAQNIDLGAQYTGYWNFNGRSTNYDGSKRNAGDNNTMYLLARFVF
jgi:hypothetical protein